MITTLISFLAATFLAFHTEWLPITLDLDMTVFSQLMMIAGSLILALGILAHCLVLIPLEKLEVSLIPHLIQSFHTTFVSKLTIFILGLFPLFSFLLAVTIKSIPAPWGHWLIYAWVIALGISLDLLYRIWKNTCYFLDPSKQVDEIKNRALNAVKNEKDQELWSSFDSLSEIASKSVDQGKIALGTQVLQSFPIILQNFFASSKSISRVNIDDKVEKETGKDEASYTLFHLLQQLEFINDRALRARMETVLRQMILTMGKIIISCAKFDLSMVSFPTHFLSKFGLKASQHHFGEVVDLTTSTLTAIAQTILTDVDVEYTELVPPFQSILTGLDAIAKETFKKNKDTKIQVLTQSFLDIRALLDTEKMSKHPDTPTIMQMINSILNEYDALEQMMRALPSLPSLPGLGSRTSALSETNPPEESPAV